MSRRAGAIIGAVLCQMSMTGFASADPSFMLTMTVSGATPSTGQVLATVFSSSDSFMSEPYREASALIDAAGGSAMVFVDLPAGSYAVSIIYDRDADGELDTNFLGIPTEPFGFSNNATALFGPPSWQDANFVLRSDMEIHIELDTAER